VTDRCPTTPRADGPGAREAIGTPTMNPVSMIKNPEWWRLFSGTYTNPQRLRSATQPGDLPHRVGLRAQLRMPRYRGLPGPISANSPGQWGPSDHTAAPPVPSNTSGGLKNSLGSPPTSFLPSPFWCRLPRIGREDLWPRGSQPTSCTDIYCAPRQQLRAGSSALPGLAAFVGREARIASMVDYSWR